MLYRISFQLFLLYLLTFNYITNKYISISITEIQQIILILVRQLHFQIIQLNNRIIMKDKISNLAQPLKNIESPSKQEWGMSNKKKSSINNPPHKNTLWNLSQNIKKFELNRGSVFSKMKEDKSYYSPKKAQSFRELIKQFKERIDFLESQQSQMEIQKSKTEREVLTDREYKQINNFSFKINEADYDETNLKAQIPMYKKQKKIKFIISKKNKKSISEGIIKNQFVFDNFLQINKLNCVQEYPVPRNFEDIQYNFNKQNQKHKNFRIKKESTKRETNNGQKTDKIYKNMMR